MDPLNLLGIILGLSVLILIVLAVSRGEFRDIERPKYEMLGLAPPDKGEQERVRGRLGVEDRVIRVGLVGAAVYYAARAGWSHPLGLSLLAAAGYLLVTGLTGWDLMYRLLGWDTRFPEQGR